jgi:hypothetical protein
MGGGQGGLPQVAFDTGQQVQYLDAVGGCGVYRKGGLQVLRFGIRTHGIVLGEESRLGGSLTPSIDRTVPMRCRRVRKKKQCRTH